MTAQHHSSSTGSAETNIENKTSQCCEFECVTKSGMVAAEGLSEEPNKEEVRIEEWTEDASSASSKEPDDEDDCQSEVGQEIVASDECVGNFGNIVVKNSSDVQFGNNTYYQGPVTIKQFVYNGLDDDTKLPIENGGSDNLGFQPESVIHAEDYIKSYKDHDVPNIVNKDKNEDKNKSRGAHWLSYVYRKRKLYSICLSSVLTVLLILLTVLLVKKYNYISVPTGNYVDNNEQDNNVPIPPPSGESTLSGKLKIIPRIEWLAQPPEHPADPLILPVPYVIILHTATENCTDQAKCTAIVRYIQTYHMESKGWWDIGYNFLIGGDGYVYEGRGWKGQGAHVYGWNSRSIGIAFVGTFNKILPPNRQILACQQLIDKGVKEGYVSKNYKLFAHRQLSSTQSPGETLYENIKTWPHWTEKPDEGTT